MADTLNTWGGIDLRLPPVLDEAKSSIQSVLTVISSALDIVLMIMEISKTFAGGVLNPTRAIIQAVVNALNGTIQDMRQMGLYLHYGDILLMKGDPSLGSIRGGYDGYERRMIGRLLDQSDPGRPKFGSQTSVLVLFFYVAADISQYERVWTFARAIFNFFGGTLAASSLPTPSGVKATFGISGTAITNLLSMNPFQSSGGSTGAPNQVNITWALAPSNNADPGSTFPPIPPYGFIVEISTIPGGLYVAWTAPTPSPTGGRNPDVQTMTSGFYVDGDTQEPIQIFGGLASLHLASGTDYNRSATSSGFVTGATPAYLLRSPDDTNIIPLDLLRGQVESDGKYLFGAVYYTSNTLGPYFTGGMYSVTISKDQLPYEADLRKTSNGKYEIVPDSIRQASTVYVRVFACNSTVKRDTPFQWDIVRRRANGDEYVKPYNPPGTVDNKKITVGSRGQPSTILTVCIPSANAVTYLDCVRTALAILVLSRSDLTTSQASNQTGLEGVSRDILNKLFSSGNIREWLTGNSSCVSFRRNLLLKVTSVAEDLIRRQSIPDGVMASRLTRFQSVVRWKWSDTQVSIDKRALPVMTVLESLQDSDNVSGVNKNFDSIGSLSAEDSQRFVDVAIYVEGFGAPLPFNAIATRANSAGVTSPAEYNKLPLLVCMDIGDEMISVQETSKIRRIWVARQLFDTTLLQTCRDILQITATPELAPGEWKYIRFFPTGVPMLEEVLRQVSQFCQRLADSTQAASDLITNFIDFYKQRVLELQNFISRIQGLVNQLDLLLDVIPPMEILVTVSQGTEGAVNDLTTANNKPTDGKDAFAAGIVALAGGAPSILVDLIKAAT